MQKLLRQTFPVILLIVISCGSSDNIQTTEAATEFEYQGFEQFPVEQYYSIHLGSDHDEAAHVLEKQNFELNGVDESEHYYRPSDSTEVILPPNGIISEFKVFIKSSQFLTKKDAFLTFLSNKSTKNEQNDDFLVLYFIGKEHHFVLTAFSEENFIRLSFRAN